MDIYSAKKYTDELLKLAKDVSESDSRLYNKSKERWKALAQNCIEIVKVISSMLQEETLLTDLYEDNIDTEEIHSMLNKMQNEIDKLTKFVNYTPPADDKVKAKLPRISGEERRAILANYRIVLKNLSTNSLFCEEADQLCKVLYRWFETRFYSSMRVDPEFRYNIRKIPEWIYYIIVVYSKHITTGDSYSFIDEFNQWIDNLVVDPSSCRYPVPYSIYAFEKENDPSMLTLTACVLYDMLLDAGLNELCKSSECYLFEGGIYQLCENLDSVILDNYMHYAACPIIIEKCNLHISGGETK